MFTEIFGNSPRVRLLDFLADHVDFDYTISQINDFTGISRPTLYKLISKLEADGILAFTREVGDSRFYRMNLDNPRVASMLRMDFGQISEELMAGRYDEKPPVKTSRHGEKAKRGAVTVAPHGSP